MQAIEIERPGPPSVLRLVERPVPQPGTGEVLIKVAAAGVNAPDLLQRRGRYTPPPGASDIPGLEIAGTVVARGTGVRSPALKAQVCALVTGGGYAEYCVASAPLCLPFPPKTSAIAAAGTPETTFTVWSNVFERAKLKAGETLLVHGGASGIGTVAIQLAKAHGSRVIVTVGSEAKCKACLELGADRAIDHTREDFSAVVAEVTGGRGVEVILDMVGGDYFPRNLASLAKGGRLALIGFQRGSRAEVDFSPVLTKHLTISGLTLRPRSVAEKAALARAVRAKVWPLFTAGKMKVVVDRTFPLAAAARAHTMLESRAHIGKVVLVV
ncbi:MAG: NAD(P)H-quinone oxidoreductase [Alphaproteobacteria bacterium]|nr:NAD(P)H-quinone oxidoreductase [Alphaproteobacteria bacterium]